MKSKLNAVLEIIRQVGCVLSRKQKIASGKSFVAILVASVFELLGVTMIIPFISAIMNADALMENVYINTCMNILNLKGSNSLIIALGITLILIYIIKNILLLFSRYIQNKYVRTLEKELSMSMLNSYMKQPYEFFVNINSAELIRGMDSDVNSFVIIITTLFSILAEMITMSFIIVFILSTDWITALTLAVFVGGSIIAITLGCKNMTRAAGEKYQNAVTQRSKAILQIFGGIKDIYVTQRKEKFVKEYNNASEKYKSAVLINEMVKQIPERIIEVVLVGGIILIVCIRIMQGYSVELYIPKLSALALACFRLLPSMNKLTTGMTQLIFYQPGLVNVYNNITRTRESHSHQNNVECTQSIQFNNKIEIKNITWQYINGNKNVLDDLSMEIKRGESVAIIGKSGEGKTTLADSILGLLEPKSGNILSDGENVFNCLNQWSKYIGYVPQSVFLLDDTIRENVLFGEKEIDDERIWKVLGQAQLEEFVKELPNGLDTMVGERGVKFSGGQRQRIAIARALYYDPEIIVFDEATSALDDGTEKAVMEAINSLQGTKTLIIIAHRLSTIENCDKIYEIKNGKAILRKKEEIYD